jgi:thymidylate synthase
MKYYSANEAYEALAKKIEDEGIIRQNTLAIFNVSFTLMRPHYNIIVNDNRGFKHTYAQKEYEWYKSGDRNPDTMIEAGAKLWSKMKDDSGYVNSNYGAWWIRNNQLGYALDLLRKDPFTRRSIVAHYSPDEASNDLYRKDTPCNVVLNFFTISNTLYITIFARSVDLVFGFCNDQYCFSKLLEDCAKELGLIPGTMHYFITNLHIYDNHIGKKY